jgi:hypothetical protein
MVIKLPDLVLVLYGIPGQHLESGGAGVKTKIRSTYDVTRLLLDDSGCGFFDDNM